MAVLLLFCLILLPIRPVPSFISTIRAQGPHFCSPNTCCFHFSGSQPSQLSILEDLIFIALLSVMLSIFPTYLVTCLSSWGKKTTPVLHSFPCELLLHLLSSHFHPSWGSAPDSFFSRYCGWQVPLMQCSFILIHCHFLILCFIVYTLSFTINT